MAATTNDNAKTSKDKKLVNGLQLWKKCEGKLQLGNLKECMDAVKDEFFKRAKKIGFDSPDKAYHPLDNGICFVQEGLMNGYSYYIGLVRLAKPDIIGGYWASIRACLPILLDGEKIQLEGFIISTFGNLNYVPNQVFKFGNASGIDNPKEWQPFSGDNLVTLKGCMDGVKDEFFKLSKQRGYDPKNKEYYPTDTGIFKQLNKHEYCVIGLVQLSKPETIGGLYASIRVHQRSFPIESGVVRPPMLKLQGFIIDIFPSLQWVPDGVYRFGPSVVLHNNDINLSSSETGSSEEKEQLFIFPTGNMDYLPTGPIQSTVDKMKDEIKKKCGIVGDLDTFQVVSATASGSLILFDTPSLWLYFVKIYIGINDMTNFSQYIYVKYSVETFGTFGATTYLASAQTFPF